MLRNAITAAIIAMPLLAQAEDRSVAYEAQYQIFGFLLRAAVVCGGQKKDIDAVFSLLGSDEFKAVSRSFPKLTEKWMTNGAHLFNTGVMKDGVPAACDYARTVLKKVTDR
jgi:hypothetical protein